MYQKIKNRSGLTLIELLIAMLLFSAIIGAAILMLSTGLKIWNSNNNRTNIRQNGSLAMETITRYLEQANNITAASASSITFSADVNNDGTDDIITIAFAAANKRINITIAGATSILAPDVQNFSLLYYQSNTQTSFIPAIQADRDGIRIVTISLTMSKGNDTVTLSSSAFCRNQGVA
ncbi:MAG: prepilin-type N-terminal cleavage/methylation domain-containing protein [Candidatus Omnitrophota bacterium]|nr:prepilin-type N-terminal cleavage/methylation domain-containing protein [Candidatus Omnitrophota bacterium]